MSMSLDIIWTLERHRCLISTVELLNQNSWELQTTCALKKNFYRSTSYVHLTFLLSMGRKLHSKWEHVFNINCHKQVFSSKAETFLLLRQQI